MTGRALVVEDNELVRRVLSRICTWLRFEAVVAADGDEGIAALRGSEFELVITDLKMPGASGIEVARHARMLNPAPAVVVVTGFSTPAEEDELAAVGAQLLRKPFEARTARSVIKAALQART